MFKRQNAVEITNTMQFDIYQDDQESSPADKKSENSKSSLDI